MNEYPHDPYERKSVMISLHQALLRSPRRAHASPAQNSERHYQSVKYLALEPTPIPPQHFLYTLRFDIPNVVLARLSRDKTVMPDTLPVNQFYDGSLRIRLRCCLKKPGITIVSESSWATSETAWPNHILMQLNNQTLTARRKQHHAKEQPVEIGPLLRAGQNVLRITVPMSNNSTSENKQPWIAVEVIETLGHSSVLRLPNLQQGAFIAPDHTKAIVKERLHGSPGDGNDDDVAMVISDLSIDLADPFSFRIFDVPVRGKDCTHLECFDLDTWLTTRQGKKHCVCGSKASSCKTCPKEPSFVDKWKCPLCSADARPYSLLVDGFLVEVRASLAAEGRLKTKSILVSADGTWKAKFDPGDDDNSDFDSDDEGTPAAQTSRSSTKATSSVANVEVIELD